MNIIADTHTHTSACSHAYSTIMENVHWAKKRGLSFLCMTEHCPAMPDAPYVWHFSNLHTIPDMIDGVHVLKGCEADIIDYDGSLDMTDKDLSALDWVIASYHTPACKPGSIEDHTRGWLGVAKNPHVDVIGHSGDGRFVFEMERVIKAFREYGKIVEINSHSFRTRPGSPHNCAEIAKCCKKFGVPVVVSSDAHFCMDIGNFADAVQCLEEIGFPEELILNADRDRFVEVVRGKTGAIHNKK